MVVLKNSQAGAGENVIGNPIRFHVAEHPLPILYIGAQQESTEDFFEDRIVAALKHTAGSRRKLAKASRRGTVIRFRDMTLTATWSSSVTGLKMKSAGLVLCDEVDIWPEYSIDKARKRADTYPFAHILICSAPDAKSGRPSAKSPIFIEFKQTDQRYWMCKDPETGHLFRFVMGMKPDGTDNLKHGLKWAASAKRADGTWDLDLVRKTAHYVTPDGTIIREQEKNDVVRTGRWVATKQHPRRGYHMSCFMSPWITLGDIACAFLDAQTKGTEALRVFVLEWLAEEWQEKTRDVGQSQLSKLEAEYKKGERLTEVEPYKTIYIAKRCILLTTFDVQKWEIYWLTREWIEGGDSGLVGWGRVTLFEQVADQAKMSVEVFGDIGYRDRFTDTAEACHKFKFVATKGADERLTMPWMKRSINPFEGTTRASEEKSIPLIVYDTWHYKRKLFDRIQQVHPRPWHVYKGIERVYCDQLGAEIEINGRFEEKAKGADNHLLDCETIQIMGAEALGFNSQLLTTGRS